MSNLKQVESDVEYVGNVTFDAINSFSAFIVDAQFRNMTAYDFQLEAIKGQGDDQNQIKFPETIGKYDTVDISVNSVPGSALYKSIQLDDNGNQVYCTFIWEDAEKEAKDGNSPGVYIVISDDFSQIHRKSIKLLGARFKITSNIVLLPAQPIGWVSSNIGSIGDRNLRNFCLGGTHDSGMFMISGGTAGANKCNTVTQTQAIATQLLSGARYLDIRPVIASGNFKCGHYSDTDSILGWQGANGAAISEVIEQINFFTSQYNEILIIEISHCRNTDDDYRVYNKKEWDNLFDELGKINFLFSWNVPGKPVQDHTLNEIICPSGRQTPAVIVFVSDDDIPEDVVFPRGIYNKTDFEYGGNYADSNNLTSMMEDQIAKMVGNSNSDNPKYFMTSWTLTQNQYEVVNCVADSDNATSIIAMNNQTKMTLPDLFLACSDTTYTNIFIVDALMTGYLGEIAMMINNKIG